VEVGVGCMLLVECHSEVVHCVVQAEGLASCLQLLPALLPAHTSQACCTVEGPR
jgi:hypothetical protein